MSSHTPPASPSSSQEAIEPVLYIIFNLPTSSCYYYLLSRPFLFSTTVRLYLSSVYSYTFCITLGVHFVPTIFYFILGSFSFFLYTGHDSYAYLLPPTMAVLLEK